MIRPSLLLRLQLDLKYKHCHFNATASGAVVAKPVVEGSLAVGGGGLVVGAEVGYDTATRGHHQVQLRAGLLREGLRCFPFSVSDNGPLGTHSTSPAWGRLLGAKVPAQAVLSKEQSVLAHDGMMKPPLHWCRRYLGSLKRQAACCVLISGLTRRTL